jgi:uncharacterized DUF497 family protein
MILREYYLLEITYKWDEEKNNLLKETRDISFFDIVTAIENKQVLEIIDNPSSNHTKQKCFVVELNNYIYLVPFVKNENEIFLKTIFPSRKHKKYYLNKKENYEK